MTETNKVLSAIVFCQCGNSEFDFLKWLRGGVAVLKCKKCLSEVKIRGLVNTQYMIDALDAAVLEKGCIVPPDNLDETCKKPKKQSDWITMHIPMTSGQREIIKRAHEIMRKISGIAKLGMGTFFEYLAANYLSESEQAGLSENAVGIISTDPTILDSISGEPLRKLGAMVFHLNAAQLYSSEDDLRKWIRDLTDQSKEVSDEEIETPEESM